ncbi:PIG-L deacetylase family protein [Streptomyces sp. NPDC001530]|uniref:PIG-L deacetylase family protein n=1 Tax=Streptomyces sp. NPDC001530 TaxID=3364582 RepID=UPI0036CAAEC2
MGLTAGPLPAEHSLNGHRGVLLALTPGERGHPRPAPEVYKLQKIAEGEEFAKDIGAEFRCFDDLSDGFLGTGDDVALRIGDVIRAVGPDVLVAHLRHSIHSNHAMPGPRTPWDRSNVARAVCIEVMRRQSPCPVPGAAGTACPRCHDPRTAAFRRPRRWWRARRRGLR